YYYYSNQINPLSLVGILCFFVEHDLAKVGVAGSSPVFRSKQSIIWALTVEDDNNVRVVELVDTLL
ncbi:MAG: hypothetical protein K2H84_03800, partial [Paramuribaculum sp.]|nr:hypothetical protein [Paramuribaculum sp.]